MSKKFLALCAIAIGKSIIECGQPLPANVDDGKIKALLANGSIEPADAEIDNAADVAEKARIQALICRATELGIHHAEEIKTKALEAMVAEAEAKIAAEPATPPASGTETVLPTVTGDGSGQALPEVSDTMKDAEGVVFDGGELAGVVTDGAIKPLEDLTVAELKKMAADAGVKGAANMNKAALVAALSAA